MNPIRKIHYPILRDAEGKVLVRYSQRHVGPWYATCPRCEMKVTGGKTRKIAKDNLWIHIKTEHADGHATVIVSLPDSGEV